MILHGSEFSEDHARRRALEICASGWCSDVIQGSHMFGYRLCTVMETPSCNDHGWWKWSLGFLPTWDMNNVWEEYFTVRGSSWCRYSTLMSLYSCSGMFRSSNMFLIFMFSEKDEVGMMLNQFFGTVRHLNGRLSFKRYSYHWFLSSCISLSFLYTGEDIWVVICHLPFGKRSLYLLANRIAFHCNENFWVPYFCWDVHNVLRLLSNISVTCNKGK